MLMNSALYRAPPEGTDDEEGGVDAGNQLVDYSKL